MPQTQTETNLITKLKELRKHKHTVRKFHMVIILKLSRTVSVSRALLL